MALTLGVPLGVALASHGFNDVPNSNPFHADIDALVDNNVTAGCGNNNYCPKANVTREQMAAFMNRLGALAPGKTPVVNADEVDGLDSSAFARPLFAVVNADGSLARGVGVSTTGLVTGFTGSFEVIFDRNVRDCAYTVTTGGTGSTETPLPGYGVATGRFTNVNGVFVRTFNSAGVETARAFHLAVSCAGSAGTLVLGEIVEGVDTAPQP
ncbi:MAG: S-layer homology domain-containing protein [Candidatus Limnocylindria bacterium]